MSQRLFPNITTLQNARQAHRQARAEPAAKQRKAIGYAYPTSPAADFYGCKKGCWYISTSTKREDGTWAPNHILEAGEGFDRPDHPDLIALYRQTEGDMCPYFKSHGNAIALAAIATL